ncbi:MAG: sigma-70 family RNA polymerase sigma factor [Labilithrix sp.]|nr:sigma-70 family RNA polymerase sigma factor [Labilithrix sp.]
MGMTSEDAKQYRWLVERIANRYARPGIDVDDLVQEGYLGLINAFETWRPDGGSSLKAWASLHVRSAICKALDAADPGFETVSMDAPTSVGERGASLHDVLGTPAEEDVPTQEDVIDEIETNTIVREEVDRLPSNHRVLLTMWAGTPVDDGKTHQQIANELGCSRQLVTLRFGQALGALCVFLHRRVHTPRRGSYERMAVRRAGGTCQSTSGRARCATRSIPKR